MPPGLPSIPCTPHFFHRHSHSYVATETWSIDFRSLGLTAQPRALCRILSSFRSGFDGVTLFLVTKIHNTNTYRWEELSLLLYCAYYHFLAISALSLLPIHQGPARDKSRFHISFPFLENPCTTPFIHQPHPHVASGVNGSQIVACALWEVRMKRTDRKNQELTAPDPPTRWEKEGKNKRASTYPKQLIKREALIGLCHPRTKPIMLIQRNQKGHHYYYGALLVSFFYVAICNSVLYDGSRSTLLRHLLIAVPPAPSPCHRLYDTKPIHMSIVSVTRGKLSSLSCLAIPYIHCALILWIRVVIITWLQDTRINASSFWVFLTVRLLQRCPNYTLHCTVIARWIIEPDSGN